VIRVRQELQGHKEFRALQELLVSKVLKVLRVALVQLEFKDLKVFRVLQAQLAFKDCKVQRVLQVFKDYKA
jgi:hypothetical protein